MRCWCSRRLASSWPTPSRTVISFSLVISSATFWRGSVAKRTSRLVRMPTSLPAAPLPPPSTTGMPEMRCAFISSSASASVASGLDGDRVHHHAGFEFLHLPHLRGLLVRLQVAVDDADAAGLRHGDRHLGLGHGVHGRGDDRDVERDLAGDAACGYRRRTGSTSDRPGLSSTSSKVSASRRGPLDSRPSPTPASPRPSDGA